MADADDGQDLAVRLEVLPGAGRGAADHELEAEGAGVPGLVGEGGLLVLRVEGADGGEGDGAVAEEHGGVVPQQRRGDVADREDGDADHGARLDADVRLHFRRGSGARDLPAMRGRGWGSVEEIEIEREALGVAEVELLLDRAVAILHQGRTIGGRLDAGGA